MRIHQMTFGMIMGDAISNSILAIDDCLRRWGFESSIYAQHVAARLKDRVLPDTQFIPHLSNQDDLLIYHYSIYSPNSRLFRAAKGRRMLVYHNITPADFFHGWDSEQMVLCHMGRQTLPMLAPCDLVAGVSEYNRQELVKAGFAPEKTAVLPLFLTLPIPEENGRAPIDANRPATWLSVGRVVPNKAIEDVLRIFAVYHHSINANSQLRLVGSLGVTRYVQALKSLVDDLKLNEAVHFIGHVTDDELRDYYSQADLYLTASKHEGVCVPLLESMAYGLPILARKSSAIPETLGGSGVLFTDLGYEAVAEMGHLLMTDTAVRHQVIQSQYARLKELSPKKAEAELQTMLQRLGVM